jgi:NAD(P)H-dependent flavin oxidoreductase YrpB (nitropropane dioxygenase family)
LKTKVTEMLGIEHPIVCGGMNQISTAEFAAAVSDAGGLGIITSANLETPERLREEIRKTMALTGKPFGVNVNMFPSVRPMPNREFVEVIVEEGVKAVETSGFKDPGEFVPRLKQGNVKIIHKATTIRHCLKAQQIGADMVMIVGSENGGATGMEDVSTLILVPALCDVVRIPVLAGGGLADGRGLAAALALGAEGVVMGTRFIATQECPVHHKYKELLVNASERDTAVIMKSVMNTHRVIRNAHAERILEMEAKGASFEQLHPFIAGEASRQFYLTGDVDVAPAMAGQAVGLIHDIPTVKELMDAIMRQAEEAIGRLATMGR